MTEYRIPELDLSTRITVALEMLKPIPERRWGWVTEFARTHDVSRTLLYETRDRAWQGMIAGLTAGQAGRPGQTTDLRIDKAFIDRAIAVLPMVTGSVRGIQYGLELLVGVQRSTGYISQALTAAGEKATAYNVQMRVPLPVLAEADEIFQGRQPCLTVVDGRSFLVLNLAPAEARDATTWGVTLLELQDRGVQFQDLASDGGTGILAGVREAELAIPLRPDLFHLLQDAHRLTQRLERAAYKAIATADRARRAALEAQGLIRRRGRRLKVKVPLPQAEVEEAQAIATYDHWCWLLGEMRQALEPLTPAGRLVAVVEAQATLETALDLLKELNHSDITAFADDFQTQLPELLAPLAWLEQQLTPLLAHLDAETQALIIWAWQQRQALNLNIDTDFPEALRTVVHAAWDTLGLFHRSSSLAEALHSWLRPHLQIHRGVPRWLLPLLQLFWNHHAFQRGKRAGSSPLELAGVQDALSLREVLDQLFGCPLTAQPV